MPTDLLTSMGHLDIKQWVNASSLRVPRCSVRCFSCSDSGSMEGEGISAGPPPSAPGALLIEIGQNFEINT